MHVLTWAGLVFQVRRDETEGKNKKRIGGAESWRATQVPPSGEEGGTQGGQLRFWMKERRKGKRGPTFDLPSTVDKCAKPALLQ